MQLSIEEKIQAAIQPLIERITVLEAESQKFKQELTAFQQSNNPIKPINKAGIKSVSEIDSKPVTVKPIHKNTPETINNHKKVEAEKKQEKEQNADGKVPKPPAVKPVSTKPVAPVAHKEQNLVEKVVKEPIKTRPVTGKAPAKIEGNKSMIVHEKKEQEKKEEEKKQHASQEKPNNKKQTKGPSTHLIKSPAVTKNGKATTEVKPAIQKKPEAATGSKSGAKKQIRKSPAGNAGSKKDLTKEAKEKKEELATKDDTNHHQVSDEVKVEMAKVEEEQKIVQVEVLTIEEEKVEIAEVEVEKVEAQKEEEAPLLKEEESL